VDNVGRAVAAPHALVSQAVCQRGNSIEHPHHVMWAQPDKWLEREASLTEGGTKAGIKLIEARPSHGENSYLDNRPASAAEGVQ
jgi:hypothetical protein